MGSYVVGLGLQLHPTRHPSSNITDSGFMESAHCSLEYKVQSSSTHHHWGRLAGVRGDTEEKLTWV